jgi:2-polyprenyl-3-methyl-5-hydroxy-6-metoxy-1,4-benzoquinol methylase
MSGTQKPAAPLTEQDNFGWSSAAPTHAHAYLMPAVLGVAARLSASGPLRIVDLGCGNGYAAAELAAMGHNVVGIDAAADGIRIARQRQSAARFECLSIYDGPALRAAIEQPADLVISLEVIEHLYDPARLLEVAREVLRPAGTLVLSTPYHGYLKNLALSLANAWDRHLHPLVRGGHVKFFSPATMTTLTTEAGFADVSIKGVGRVPLLWKSMVVVARSGEPASRVDESCAR